MKIVKRTKKYFYVELGDKDLDEVFSSSDLIRVERKDIDEGFRTLSDMVKCDNDYEEINYPDDWCRVGWLNQLEWHLPKNIDEVVITEDMVY